MKILSEGMNKQKKLNPLRSGYFIALDIGTTTVVCYLLDGRTGETLASVSQLNPQTIYGADVISRIQSALHHGSQLLTKGIRDGITQLITKACEESLAPGALCLGTGGCRVCKKCAYPEVCRYPEKAYSSMEAYGLFVTQVCRDNHIPYYHGKMTITYTSCVLFFKNGDYYDNYCSELYL